MDIFAFSGSNKSKNSITYEITKKLCEEIKRNSENIIDYNIFNISNISLELCKGCCYCFYNQKCIKNDNHKYILNQIEQADLLIIGSPVYLHNLSGITKNFFDRFAYLSHTMNLAGRLGIIISTSSSTGNKFIEDYMIKILNYFGVTVIDILTYKSQYQNMDDFNIEITRSAKKYINITTKEEYIRPTEFQEKIFKFFKNKYKNSTNTTKEKSIWINSRFNEFVNFYELYNYKRLGIKDE